MTSSTSNAALRVAAHAIVLLHLHVVCAGAQPPRRHGSTLHLSVMGGGVAVADSRLYLAKGAVERGRWSVMLDATRDATRERWLVDDSRGEYVAFGGSAQLRRYSRRDALGWFVEAGGGAARAELRVADDGVERARTATVTLATWGVGARLSMRAPAFLEFGYRSIIVLTERHLYVDQAPPPGSTDDFVTYHSWYFKRGRATGQPYVGIGLRF